MQKFIVRKRLLEPIDAAAAETGSADRLRLMIAKIIGCPAADVKEESILVTDMGLTSIARLELANALEQEYRIDLDDAAIGTQTTVSELRSIITKREKSPQPKGLRLWTATEPVRLIRRLADAILHRPLFGIFVELQPEGVENITRLGTPVMFISNHVSYLDQPTVMGAIPPRSATGPLQRPGRNFSLRISTPCSGRLWKMAAFEYCSILMGVFPLPQSSGFRATVQHMGRLVDRGNSLLLFPEGERTQDSGLLPFQKGLGVMVQELGVPVVPVAIIGLEKILPRRGQLA